MLRIHRTGRRIRFHRSRCPGPYFKAHRKRPPLPPPSARFFGVDRRRADRCIACCPGNGTINALHGSHMVPWLDRVDVDPRDPPLVRMDRPTEDGSRSTQQSSRVSLRGTRDRIHLLSLLCRKPHGVHKRDAALVPRRPRHTVINHNARLQRRLGDGQITIKVIS